MQEFNPKIELDNAILQKEIIVTNQDEYTHWGDVMKLCKNKIKEIEDERKEFTKPLDEAKKVAMNKEKEIVDPLKLFIDRISIVCGNWWLVEEKKRKEEQKRLEEEAIKNAKPEEFDIIVPVVESIKTTKGDFGTTTGIKYNDYIIIDESLIPREYLIVNESFIREAINKGRVKEIPGIKIEEKVRFMNR